MECNVQGSGKKSENLYFDFSVKENPNNKISANIQAARFLPFRNGKTFSTKKLILRFDFFSS